jgi:hypothetical protein
MMVNDDSRVVNKLETSFTDDARVVFCDIHMFIIQATGVTRTICNSGELLERLRKIVA